VATLSEGGAVRAPLTSIEGGHTNSLFLSIFFSYKQCSTFVWVFSKQAGVLYRKHYLKRGPHQNTFLKNTSYLYITSKHFFKPKTQRVMLLAHKVCKKHYSNTKHKTLPKIQSVQEALLKHKTLPKIR
jgi:hypothetical protein